MIGTYVELRDQALRVENALRQVLERQEVWHCNRVWEAWAVDTMSRDDFSLVTEDPVAIEELVQAVMSVSGAATVSNAATEKRSSAKIADLVYENAKLKAERDAALAAAGVTPQERDAVREKSAMRRVWKAMGCEQNPDDFKLTVRDSMWDQIVDIAEKDLAKNNRLYRENEELRAALAAPVQVDEAKLAVAVPAVPYGPAGVPADRANAGYYRSAAKNIRYHASRGRSLMGSNLTEAVARLCDATADALHERQRLLVVGNERASQHG